MEVYRFSKPRIFGQGGNGIIEDDFGNVYEVQIEDHKLNFQPSPTAGTIDLVFDYDPANSEVQFDSVLFPIGQKNVFNVNKICIVNDEISIKGHMVMSEYITSPIFNDSLTAHEKITELLSSVDSAYHYPDDSVTMAKQIRQGRDESARRVPSGTLAKKTTL